MSRRLGTAEYLLWLLDQQQPMNVVVAAHVKGAIAPNALDAALANVQRRHPALRRRVVGEKYPRFESDNIGPIPVQAVARRDEATWRGEAEAQLYDRFELNHGPLARVVLVANGSNEAELLFVYHHCIGDPLSGVFAMRDLVEEMGTPGALAAPGGRGARLPERTPLEAHVERKVRLSYLNDAIDFAIQGGRTSIVGSIARKLTDGLPWPKRRDRAPRTRSAGFRLTSGETDQLRTRSIAAGASIRGAVAAALLLATTQRRGTPPLPAAVLLSALDIRDLMDPVIEDDFGVFVSGAAQPFVTQGPKDFWTLAKEVEQRYEQTRKGELHFLSMSGSALLFSAVAPPDSWGLQVFERVFRSSAVTAGHWTEPRGMKDLLKRYGPLTLDRLHVLAAPFATHLFASSNDFGGALTVDLHYPQSLVTDEEAAGVAAAMRLRLR